MHTPAQPRVNDFDAALSACPLRPIYFGLDRREF
jgi:hypothetical protein